jgi:hypothetical protein
MSWAVAVWPALVALALAILPGAAIAYILGFRWISLAGLAPVFSFSIISITAIASSAIHLSWGLLPLVLGTALAALLSWLVRLSLARWLPSRRSEQDGPLIKWALLGLALAAVAISARMVAIIGTPANISQTYDNVFHLNTLRYILDSGNASSLSLSGFAPSGIEVAGFYPAAWHDLTSLVAQLSGMSIPISVSATTIVIGAFVWPVGFIYLIRTISGARRFPVVAAGVIASGMAVFPYFMMSYGVLYPFMAGLALLPAVWAICIRALGLGHDVERDLLPSLIALAIAIPGISLAHPSATMAIIVLCGPLVLTLMIRQHIHWHRAGARWPRIAAMYAGGVALVVLVGYLFRKIQPGNVWKPQQTWTDALAQLAFDSLSFTGPAVVTMALIITGIVVLIHKRSQAWLAGTWFLFAALYAVGAAATSQRLRVALIGVWYGDVHRVAALLTVVGCAVATVAIVWIFDVMSSSSLRIRWMRHTPIVAAAALVTLFALMQCFNLGTVTSLGRAEYAMDANSKLLTPDEEALLNEVAGIVPPDVKVIGNPWTGTPLVYAYSNRVPLLSRPGVGDAKISAISQHLQDALIDPQVCAAIKAHQVGFVLDFGDREVHGDHHEYAGLQNLKDNPSVAIAARVGDASLWRITAC